MNESCDWREEIVFCHPFAKCPAADNACKTADHNGSSKAERLQLRLCAESRVKSPQHSDRQSERRSKAKNVSDKFWKMGASRIQHSHRFCFSHHHRNNPCRKHDPEKECVT